MKGLVLGNSHASCLKIAYDKNYTNSTTLNLDFYITPGGYGPHFFIKNNLLEVPKFEINPKFPPRYSTESVLSTKINEYDFLIISALGFIDPGPVNSTNKITSLGCIYEFKPKLEFISSATPVSKQLVIKCANQLLSLQRGFRLLEEIKSTYKGIIVVQRSPNFSVDILDDPNWALQRYERTLEAHNFFNAIRGKFLESVTVGENVFLLDHPEECMHESGLTTNEFMQKDKIHGNELYGVLVLNEINNVLRNI